MNTQTNNLFKAISKDETKKLVTVVSETMAFDLQKERSFTSADLWNIQRRGRSMLQRRRFA